MNGESWTFPSGNGHFKIEEYAARVSGLFVNENKKNLLWQGDTLPVLGTRIEGGDRMWLAPQWDVFDWDGNDVSTMRLPAEMDPGSWQGSQDANQVKLQQTFLGAKMIREISPFDSPKIQSILPHTGYKVHDQVVTEKRLSSWHLLMVPHPADILVHSAHSPVDYFGSPPSIHNGWIVAEKNVNAWKIGLSPESSGKIAIGAFSKDDPGGLVVIMASAAPNGTYIDYPPGGSLGTAIQIYNSGGGGFCEIEHHAPLETQSHQAFVFGFWGEFQKRLSAFNSLITQNLQF